MHDRRFDRFTDRHLGKRETLFNPEEWPDDNDRGANWDYVLSVLGAFGLFILVVTVGMLAWVLGII